MRDTLQARSSCPSYSADEDCDSHRRLPPSCIRTTSRYALPVVVICESGSPASRPRQTAESRPCMFCDLPLPVRPHQPTSNCTTQTPSLRWPITFPSAYSCTSTPHWCTSRASVPLGRLQQRSWARGEKQYFPRGPPAVAIPSFSSSSCSTSGFTSENTRSAIKVSLFALDLRTELVSSATLE